MPRIVQDDSQQSQILVQVLGESQYDYEVADAPLNCLNAGPQVWPARLAEWKLIEFLKAKAVAFAGDDATLARHMQHCIKQLDALAYNVGSAQSREMIGEILGAVPARMGGWRMVRGYNGKGHHGIDQIWEKGDLFLIVECKGGRGNLDDRQRYFEGITHKAELGMNNNVTQMSKAWVFMGCNHIILKQMFASSMIRHQQHQLHYLSPSKRAALLICLRLWKPAQFQINDGALCYRNSGMALLIAPTRFFNRFFGWQKDKVIRLPGLIGIVVKNGQTIKDFQYAETLDVLCEDNPAQQPQPQAAVAGNQNPANNVPAPHRFQPGILPQLLNLNNQYGQ